MFATQSVLAVCPNDLVIARHFAWPWPERLDANVCELGGEVLNNARAYRYAENPIAWSSDLGDLTPRTWEHFEELPEGKSFILKGAKADKGRWDRMFAADRRAASELRSELWRDSGMRGQTIVAREYVPLERLGENIGGLPVSTEFRVFVCDGQEISRGFYWPIGDCGIQPPDPSEIPAAFLAEAICRVAPRIRFFALDVARAADGHWLVIEVNDGQRSGMSNNDPAAVYAGLARVLSGTATGRAA